MKRKRLLYYFISMVLCTTTWAQKKDQVARQLVGSWKYNTELNVNKSKDSCQVYLMYTFKDNGIAEIKSIDEKKCDNSPVYKFWTIIKMHDLRGSKYFAVRLTEDEMPERDSYDGLTFQDQIFLITKIKNNTLYWVAKDPYNRPSIKAVATYSKIIF